MLRLTRSQLKRYGVATITFLLAVLLTRLLWQLQKLTIYPLFLGAVMISSWYGGIGPGLLATVLSTLACAFLFLPPLYSLTFNLPSLVGLIQFVLVALLINSLNAALRYARRQAEMNARAAQQNYDHLRQSQQTLRDSEERYRLLIEGVTNYAIFMLGPKGHFVSWNIGAERILGYQEAEIIGQPFEQIFTPEAIERGQPEQALRKALAEGFSKENHWHVRKDGTHFWAHCVITPLQDEDGNLRGFSKIMQDITERKLAEEERNQLLLREQAARASAEAANRSKDEFLAIVSHELRTPMTAIVGWAGMLQTGMLDESRAADAIETIERNANLQMQLIEDLLDISRIIRGELSLNRGRVNLVEVITPAIEVVQGAADAKGIQLESVLDNSVEQIWGDSERLQQVLLNLLSNAIKFTPNGGRVEVRLSVVSGNEQLATDNSAQIQVSDTGKGISADFLPYVFDRFRQADSTSTRSNKGLGLGLAITRHLVELHGGTIQAQSQGIGQGATFTVKLPILEQRSQESVETFRRNICTGVSRDVPAEHLYRSQEEINSSESCPSSLNGLRVLVVDDEADTRLWISTVLEKCGAEVIAVGSVGEALAALEQLRPDVLISDIGMPDEDGYELMRKIRELEPKLGGRIPAVALTGYARVEDYKEALEAGFQLHVAKPVRAAELVVIVASLANTSESQ
ncbi:ATP-binding protein [Iningainema tapete]|uniref:Circadian input-output histidine kinase CikA n=1 Tax=Iningainema tapete BLCC-T55 TaxID=2748662 RepID=A0A8J7BXL4_9CYAN|nr:ATP-binding protein [Iningainema tapete]MBD2774002.1 PAS domain S-box protein [Iningainema tapete BLCC-T55]